MYSHKLFPSDVSYSGIDQFYDRYDSNPCVKPGWNIQYRKQLYQADHRKYAVCDRIQS